MNNRALIGMSGGVDSSVAAALMCRAGYECIGVNMKLYAGEIPEEGCKTCCSLEDAEDARSICYQLGMKFYVFNFTRDFSREVMEYFVAEYESGATPNPCIDCNRTMKFGKLMERARLLDCDTVVSGHYARVEYDESKQRYLLKKARNAAKDQSYVLYFLTQEQLAHIRFPLGDFESKEQIRALAREMGFVTAKKKDSQDICFVPDGDYAAFIQAHTGRDYPQGQFVDENGKVLGTHKGIIRYTIGQRRGLGLSLPYSMYVKGKDVAANQVILSSNEALFSHRLIADSFNWSSIDAPAQPIRVWAKTRYQAKEAPATATVLPDGRVALLFDQPQRALTPGQAVVLYDGDTVVGGGVIREV